LKRFMADYAMDKGLFLSPPENPRKEKVAIIGSGPAGLSCAFYLTRLGYLPVIYEALPVAGGMMATAIPEYRLPRRILNYDIERIKKAGVQIKLSSPVRDIDDLFELGYHSVFIATGTPQGQQMEIEGKDLEGVMTGVDFLRQVFLNGLNEVDGDVVVIGGGNSAIDSARSALRLGARNVTIVYRRMKSDMPATEEEIEDALEEGVQILDMTMPARIMGNAPVEGVKCVKMKMGEFDSSGRRRPVSLKNSEYLLKANLVIISIGQRPNLEFLKDGKIRLNRWGFIEVDPLTMATSQRGVFAGGDVITGSATVIEAVAAGRKAAIAIDRYLGGEGTILSDERQVVETNYDEAEYLNERPRQVPQVLPLEKRKTGFEEVRLRFSLKQAMEEARRCLHCDREEE